MANVRVAVRVRPLSKRETKEGGRIIMEVDDRVAKIRNLKVDNRLDGFGDSREKTVAFSFDYCYWSVNPEDPQYASQDVVFQDLGTEVLSGAAKGYNICLFAYGQTGSGKTYTMLGTPASVGLTPRICEGLFIREGDGASLPSSCRITVSFLEIYNERVRDLLKQSDKKKPYNLRVREHPEMGPYVQGLSQHVVTNYKQVIQLLEEGIANRITAPTHVHEASSRSHAIFTIHCTQAVLENNLPSEIASKINLVDLAGSERADPSYCKDRITEGASINKSLVTLGIVISTLAQNSRVLSSCQSLKSIASSVGDGRIPLSPGASSGGRPSWRQTYIPYRDSVLTWLLKDSLGGNSKTIMVATVSPAHTSYNETMSTLRYASSAKNIVNEPRVNEDANVKLIRELREEIERLKAMLLSFELRNFCSLDDEKDENLKELVLQNELKIDKLTKEWTRKWDDWQALLEHYSVDINKMKAGVVINSSLPHLMALEDDVLSTGVVLYYLKEGITKIGRIDSDQEQDIVLQGQWIERDHCTITSACGVVILQPAQGARCTVNGQEVTASCRLTQGAVITLGKAQKFRFNHPAEAAILRRQRQVGEAISNSGSLKWLDLDRGVTATWLGLCPLLSKERRVLEEQCVEDHQPLRVGETHHRAHVQQYLCCVKDLRQQTLVEQIGAGKELEANQASTSHQIKDNQSWLLREETWQVSLQEQQQQVDLGAENDPEASVAPKAGLQTDHKTPPSPLVGSRKRVKQWQLLQRLALRTAEQNSRQSKVSFRTGRIAKKRRLPKARKRLEQLRALLWLWDDSIHKPPCRVSSSDVTVAGPQRRNKWMSCSSLSLQSLCKEHSPHLHSVFLNWDLSTMLPPVPDAAHQVSEKTESEDHFSQTASYPPRTGSLCKNGFCSSGQEQLWRAREALPRKGTSAPSTCLTESSQSVDTQAIERVGKQPSWTVSAKKLKPRDGPKSFTCTAQTRRAKGLAGSGSTQTGWHKEDLATHKATKGTGCSSYPWGPKQAAGHGKTAKTFQAEYKPSSPSRASKRDQKVLAGRVRDVARKFSHFPCDRPLKREHGSGNPDTTTSFDSSLVDCAREKDNDLSDTDSNYSEDSLSCVCAKASLMEPLKPEGPQGKWGLLEPENSESDNSQISEDSLAEKGYQSPKESSRASHPTNNHDHPRTRTRATMRAFTAPSDSGLCVQDHRSFSLDSLIDAEIVLEEDQQAEPFLGSADEMPTETFWHLQNSTLPLVDQEAMCRPRPINHKTGASLDAILPMSGSFFLDPQFQPHCEQRESEVEAAYSEPANSLQHIQLSRESPLVSMDSWFSCDSKINSSSPSGIVGSLCPSPDIQEVHPCGDERLEHWLNIEKLKPPGSGTILPCWSKLPQGSTELSCSARDVYPVSASDTSKLSLWEKQRFLQPGADGIFQGRGDPDTTKQGISEVSCDSSVSGVLATSATSSSHVHGAYERDWAALQQKYLLELSHPVPEAIGKPRPVFSCPVEDSSSLTEASVKGRDIRLPVGPELSNDSDFNNFPAEKEQDSLSASLEIASDFFSTSEKEVSCNGAYSADLESLASRSTNAQICATENKMPNSIKNICEIKQTSLKECFQCSRKPGQIASSDEYFFQKDDYDNSVTIATKADYGSQGQMSFRKNSTLQPGQSNHNHHHPLQKEKADCQEGSKEVGGRHTGVAFSFPSGPELYLHSAPWNRFPSSLQPPPLETFYVTKSRDALTETALEIPACREGQVPSPPAREAWGFGHNHQVLQKTHLENNFPAPLQSQNSKIASYQQVTEERPLDPNTRKVIGELGECIGSIKEGSQNSVYFFVAQNRHFLPSANIKVYRSENQVGILHKKHSLSAFKEGEKATTQFLCGVSLDSSASEQSFFIICESETGEKEEQDHIQAFDKNREIPSRARSDFICKTTSIGLEKDMPGETAVSLKSRLVQHRVRSPIVMTEDTRSACKSEGRNETGLLGKALHPHISPEEFKLPGTESAYERFQSVTFSQERNLGECKGPRGSHKTLNYKEKSLGKKQSKRINNADELAGLIRSVMQLERGILEIESKQNKQLCTSHTTGVSKEFVFQDQKDQERKRHAPRSGNSGNYLSFKDQSYYPKQTDDVIFSNSEATELAVNRPTRNDPQIQKMAPDLFWSRDRVQESQSVGGHARQAGLNRPAMDVCDSSGTRTSHRESTNTSLHSRRMKALARALPMQPRPGRSEKGGEPVEALASSKEKPWGLGSLEEPDTVEGFSESQIAKHISSSKPEESKAQVVFEEMVTQREGSLQDENDMVSLTQKLPTSIQHCTGTFFSQETVSPLLSQKDFSVALHQDLSNTLLSHSPRPPRNSHHSSDTISTSSVDHMLDPTVLQIHKSPLVTVVGYQNQSEETSSHSLQGNVSEDSSMSSMTHTAWCMSVKPMAMGCPGKSDTSESISLGTEDRVTASNSSQDQVGDIRITLMDLNTLEGFDSEAEAAVQKGIRASSLNRVSRQLEKKVSFSLEENNDQGREARHKAEKEVEDQGLTSSAHLAPVSLPRVPNPEPRLVEPLDHSSMFLAILDEIRQAKAQRKQLTDFGAEGTVLPYYETSIESECSTGAPGRPQGKQMEQLVSGRTRNEDEAQESHGAPLSAAPGSLSADERKVRATPLCADSFLPLKPSPEASREPWHPSQASSHAPPALDERPCPSELRHVLGASEQFIHLSSSSEILEKEKETPTMPSSADPVTSNKLLFSAAVEGDSKVSSQDPCDDPVVNLHEQSQCPTWETVEAVSPGSRDSSPEHQERKTLGSTYGGGTGNILVAAQEGKTAHFESQSVICDVENSASSLQPKQDDIACHESPTGLEGRASPKQHAVLPRALRKVGLEASTQQCVMWKGNIGPGLAETCRTGSQNSRSTPLPDQRPTPDPRGTGEEPPCRGSKETRDCLVSSGNMEGSRTFSSSKGEEESKTISCQQLCDSQTIATRAYSPHSSTLLLYRDGDMRREISKAAPHSVPLPSRACVDEVGSSSKDTDAHLAHGPKPKGINRKLEPLDSSTSESSAVAAVPSQGCSSLCTPDVRTSSRTHSAADGSSRPVRSPEEKVAEKASTEHEAASFPTGTYSEPTWNLKDRSLGGHNLLVSQTKPEPSATIEAPHTPNLGEESVESKLVLEPQHECLRNSIRCLSEKLQPSKSRDHSCSDSPAKSISGLKHIFSPQIDNSWEEEEQQRDQSSGGGEDPAQGRHSPPSDEGGVDGCHIRDAGPEEVAVIKTTSFEDTAPVPLGTNEVAQPAAQRPGWPCSSSEPVAPQWRSLPVIAVFCGPKHARSSPRPQFSVVSSSRSLQELNLTVEPPSPTDEDLQESNRLWNPHLRGCSPGKSVTRTFLKAEDYSQKTSSNLDNGPAHHRPLKPATPPYPTSSTLSCMPTPDFMTGWTSGTLDQDKQGNPEKRGILIRPENWGTQVGKGMLHWGSSDTNPYVLPRCPEDPVHIGWKQYVFGSAGDVSCTQEPHILRPSSVARCSSMDNVLEDQNSPFRSHLSTCAETQDLASTHGSIDNAQGSNEAWEAWSSSFALGEPHISADHEGVSPTLGPYMRPQPKGPTDAAGCLRSELPLAEDSSAGPVDEIVLLYPSEVGCPVGRAQMNTLEQGTQTLGCRLHWSCADYSAQPDTSAVSVSDLASWTNMHNLSLHLSQLLHSTTELLGSLSRPSVAKGEQDTRRNTPEEAPQALMLDSATQTNVDKGSQTDLALPPLHLQARGAKPQEVSMILEGLDSDISSTSQQEGDVSGAFQKRETEEVAGKTSAAPDIRGERTHCRLQSPPTPFPHLRFQKAPLGQNLPSVNSPTSPIASLPPAAQLEESSCMVMNSPSLPPSLGVFPSPSESTQKPRGQKLGPTSAVLVDRASSPILALSVSTQELGPPSDSLTRSAPSVHPLESHQKLDSSQDLVLESHQKLDSSQDLVLESHQKLDSSQDLVLGAPRPPVENYSQTTDVSSGSQRVGALGRGGRSPLGRSNGKLFLELSSPCTLPQSPRLQGDLLRQSLPQLQPRDTAGVQSRLPPPPLRLRSQRLDDSFVPEEVASPDTGLLSIWGPCQRQSQPGSEGESSAPPEEPQPALDLSSSPRGQHLSPCPISELTLTDTAGLPGSNMSPPQACQPEGRLCPSPHVCLAPEPQDQSLRDLPVHNKFSNWGGVPDSSPGGLGMREDLGTNSDLTSGEQKQRPLQPPGDQRPDPEWSQGEQIPLQVGAQNCSLSVELTEAKLHHGFGEADALLQVLQRGTGEALASEEAAESSWEELYTRQKKAIETLRKERAERLQNFRRTRSLSPQKQLSLLPSRDLSIQGLDLPSRRREYLQQLRKHVVETTRSPESASKSAHPPTDIELMLRSYQQAREETKVEIARAQDRLRERTEQEKLKIRQQIISQLLREEDRLHALASSRSLCSSYDGSLSSGVTSGYNSSPALSGQLLSPGSMGDSNLPDSKDTWIGDGKGRSALRNLYLGGSAWKSSALGCRTSLGSCCCSPSSLSSSGNCFSSFYQDMAKHIVDTSMADVMAACSDNLHNLFSRQAGAGWNYQGEEEKVQLYYKEFSSTRHGFLGAGVVSQPLSHVWAAVSDPTLWPLYHKPIQTARLHQRVTKSISLVYLVCDTTLCALKQLRDFCCVCVEAKEVPALPVGHLSIMAAQSVYDTSMPRPSRNMVRGEILPSAWILQPITTEGKEITRVIYLAQVELGAPGFPPHLLSSFIKQQPLVVARLASFLGS